MGRQQAGDMCHSSPLNVFAFGVVDNSKHDPEEMTCHCHGEEDGGKGANNVCSMLMDFLANERWPRENETGEALCVVADNCCGQNENSTVIRLMLCLVEMKHFEKACVTFLVRGHTKNCCDRMFNLMKKDFHKRDLFAHDDVLTRLGSNDRVSIVDFPPEEFRDWGKHFDQHYKKMVSGTVAENHVFCVFNNKPTTMMISQCMGADEELNPKERDFLKKGTNGPNRKHKMQTTMLANLTRPGLNPMKQVELFTKWRKFVPTDLQDEVCPEPSRETMMSVRKLKQDERKEKAKVVPGKKVINKDNSVPLQKG